jgi:PAS domain-containing protein
VSTRANRHQRATSGWLARYTRELSRGGSRRPPPDEEREIVFGWLNAAVRRGSFAEAARWLHTLSALRGAGAAQSPAAPRPRRAHDALVLSSRRTHRILEVSEPFCALTGYRREDLLGRRSAELGLAGDEPAQLHRRDGTTLTVQLAHALADGEALVLTALRERTADVEPRVRGRRFARSAPGDQPTGDVNSATWTASSTPSR